MGKKHNSNNNIGKSGIEATRAADKFAIEEAKCEQFSLESSRRRRRTLHEDYQGSFAHVSYMAFTEETTYGSLGTHSPLSSSSHGGDQTER